MTRRSLSVTLIAWLALGVLARCESDRTRMAERPASWNVASYRVREGKVVFNHYCAVCHGAEGKGDGFNSYNLDPKPRNLADPQLQAERSDEELLKVIEVGGGAVGLSNAMPPWGRTINRRQIRNLVAYVRSLREAPPPGGGQSPAGD